MKYFIGIILIWSHISCRNIVSVDFSDFKKTTTVNSILIQGDSLKVHISMADELGSNPLSYIENANVKLYINDKFTEQLTYSNQGTYISNHVIQTKNKYTCKVNIVDSDQINCSQTIPANPVITNIEHINVAGKDEEGTSYPALKISFLNNIENKSFYEIEIRNIIRFRTETVVSSARIYNIVDPVILNEGLPIALFSNEMINDSIYTITLNYTTNSAGARNDGPMRTSLYPFVIELRQVTEDYYRFKKQLYLYNESRYADGIITSMTNANLYSNIENGYGIFAAYSSTVSDTITPNTDGYYY